MDQSEELIIRYFPELEGKKELFKQMKASFIEWNEKINVISRKDTDNFFIHHVLHSLSIAKFFQFQPAQKVIDVGTGGGFPGIPLAVMFPEVDFLLVDSIGKKIQVVNAIIEDLNLTNAQGLCSRMEAVQDKFDWIVTRAVAPMNKLHGWTRNIRRGRDGGLIALKGGDLNAELKEFGKPHQIHQLAEVFEEPFFETKKIVFAPF